MSKSSRRLPVGSLAPKMLPRRHQSFRRLLCTAAGDYIWERSNEYLSYNSLFCNGERSGTGIQNPILETDQQWKWTSSYDLQAQSSPGFNEISWLLVLVQWSCTQTDRQTDRRTALTFMDVTRFVASRFTCVTPATTVSPCDRGLSETRLYDVA